MSWIHDFVLRWVRLRCSAVKTISFYYIALNWAFFVGACCMKLQCLSSCLVWGIDTRSHLIVVSNYACLLPSYFLVGPSWLIGDWFFYKCSTRLLFTIEFIDLMADTTMEGWTNEDMFGLSTVSWAMISLYIRHKEGVHATVRTEPRVFSQVPYLLLRFDESEERRGEY